MMMICAGGNDDDMHWRAMIMSQDQLDMYFLYFSMFLCRMSSIGPSSRLKASLSIEIILQWESHLMLACLVVFFTRAISPK